MATKELTEEQIIKEIASYKLDYDRDFGMALHCSHCVGEFKEGKFGEDISPRDALSYELITSKIPLSNGGAIGIVSVWCKNCGRHVWDSRHLTHRY